MSETCSIKPLGQVLQSADLISTAQIDLALREQNQAKNMRLGEILVLRGWLKQETADFFAEQWSTLLNQKSKQPLGQYLKQAGLLDEQQIQTILIEQKQMKLRFGELAVLNGWLKPTTLNFFLTHLDLRRYQSSLQQGTASSGESYSQAEQVNLELAVKPIANRSLIKLFKFDEKAYRPDILLQEVFFWTGNHPFLTQKLCQLLNDLEGCILAGEEAETVRWLVETHILQNWENQVASEHLKAIQDGLLRNEQCSSLSLLKLYQQILQQREVIADGSLIQAELLNLGLVVQQQDQLKISNRIYQSVFNQSWVDKELLRLQPLSHKSIKLLQLNEKAARPEILLKEVLVWTGGEPLLTQTLCQMLSNWGGFIPAGEEAEIVQRLVQTHLINNWDQVGFERLKEIREGLVRNKRCNTLSLLKLYQQILQQGQVLVDESHIQAELLNLGLVVQQQDQLKVSNHIYESVFNQSWIDKQLARLQPFSNSNIKLFILYEKAAQPDILLEEVLLWTNGQPFLTQKLCQLLCNLEACISDGEEAETVQWLVQNYLINNWENQVASEHLKSIRDDLLNNKQCTSLSLLKLYQQILQQGGILADESPAQAELLKLNLVVQQQNQLKVSNRIYQSVFNQTWVNQELEKNLQSSSSQTTISTQSLEPEMSSIKEKKNVNSGRIWILLGIVGLFIVGFNIVCLSLFNRYEVESLFKKGNEFFNKKQYKAAIATYNEILNIDSNYYQAWTNRGYALAGIQQYSKMLESCSAATIIEPKAIYAWNCQGEALLNLQQHKEAVTAFNKAIVLNPNDPVFLINKTESLLALKQTDAALETINKAIELFGKIHEDDNQEVFKKDFSVALSYKGKALSQKQEYEEALKAFNQALEQQPNYFVAQRGRGLALQGLKRYDEASTQFYQTINNITLTDAQKAETWYYLGLTQCQSSQVKDAFVAFDEALKLKPDYQAAKDAKKKCTL